VFITDDYQGDTIEFFIANFSVQIPSSALVQFQH